MLKGVHSDASTIYKPYSIQLKIAISSLLVDIPLKCTVVSTCQHFEEDSKEDAWWGQNETKSCCVYMHTQHTHIVNWSKSGQAAVMVATTVALGHPVLLALSSAKLLLCMLTSHQLHKGIITTNVFHLFLLLWEAKELQEALIYFTKMIFNHINKPKWQYVWAIKKIIILFCPLIVEICNY